MTYPLTWSIAALERTTSDNIVYVAHYNVLATSDDGFTASSYSSIGLPSPDPATAIPYDDITEDTAITWVRDTLGSEQLSSIAAALTQSIEEQRNPTRAQGVPWTNAD